MYRRTLQGLLIVGLCIVSSTVAADEEDNSELHLRVKHLATLLVSANKDKPSKDGRWPPGYKEEAQVTVYLAINELFRSGDAGFDEVLKHTGDNRYCYSYKAPSGCYHVTVGNACQRIAHKMICCYSDYGKLHYITSDTLDGLPRNMQLTREWRSKHRDIPLWKLQVEAIEMQIDFMQKLDHQKASSPHPHAKQLTQKVFESRREENVATLKAMKSSIEASEEPYSPKSIDSQYGAMMGLPWPTRNWGLEGR